MEISRNEAKRIYCLIYLICSIVLWYKNYAGLDFVNNINSINIDVVGETTNDILLITTIGYALTIIGLSKLFKLNNFVLIFGISGLLISTYFLFGPVLFYYYD